MVCAVIVAWLHLYANSSPDGESLSGNGLSIFLAFTGSPSLTSDTKIEEYLKGPNLWKVPARFRGAVFNYVQRKAICSINAQVQVLAEKYAETVKRYRYGGFENDAVLLRQQKVVGGRLNPSGTGSCQLTSAQSRPLVSRSTVHSSLPRAHVL